MNRIFVILLLLSGWSCKTDKVNEEALPKIEQETLPLQENRLNFHCNTLDTANFDSQLLKKAALLAALENNYLIKSKEIEYASNSRFLARLKRLDKSKLNKRENNYIIEHFDEIKNTIYGSNYCFVKGTKNLGDNTYPRADIEEIIFKSEACAIAVLNIVEIITDSGYTWEEIDKAPNSIFREGNKLYYIRAGGWYMMAYYKEIAKKMKE